MSKINLDCTELKYFLAFVKGVHQPTQEEIKEVIGSTVTSLKNKEDLQRTDFMINLNLALMPEFVKSMANLNFYIKIMRQDIESNIEKKKQLEHILRSMTEEGKIDRPSEEIINLERENDVLNRKILLYLSFLNESHPEFNLHGKITEENYLDIQMHIDRKYHEIIYMTDREYDLIARSQAELTYMRPIEKETAKETEELRMKISILQKENEDLKREREELKEVNNTYNEFFTNVSFDTVPPSSTENVFLCPEIKPK